jgi:hypothetical protein
MFAWLLIFENTNETMQQEVLRKIYSDKYEYTMDLDEYIGKVSIGLQLIEKSGLDAAINNRDAVNLALEYNMELMFDTLLQV